MDGAASERIEYPSGRLLEGRYRLGELLGSGGAGAVLSALDERLERRVAIKVVRTPRLASAEAIERFKREARATVRIGHPNIVQVFDVGTTEEGWPFLVLEELRGRTLAEALDETLSISRALDVHIQLLDALEAAHAVGVLHRDVKPSNVFLSPLATGSDLVTLLDFGLATLLESTDPRVTDTGMVLGSPTYVAPERLAGADATPASDVYAVGVCLFETLTGRPPFVAANLLALRGQILTAQSPRASALRADVPVELSDVIARAMARDPADRFGTAASMRDALAALAPKRTATVRPPAESAPPSRGQRPSRWAVPVAIGAGGAAALLLWLSLASTPDAPASRGDAPAVLAAVPSPPAPAHDPVAVAPAPLAAAASGPSAPGPAAPAAPRPSVAAGPAGGATGDVVARTVDPPAAAAIVSSPPAPRTGSRPPRAPARSAAARGDGAEAAPAPPVPPPPPPATSPPPSAGREALLPFD
jgi:serine/threonine-protein kinase